ncbi:MAG: protein-(glutamine-N5) methyltransferase, release factor-specific [Deltaproteobacteria bacterium GWC2_55_46]|nr:MAG: protein-(glutamine-N5) methyltransferase, release factor-specific [Deltaproteobacteria bacterium GWA2_55_82]OGQ65250.1 MAG: protein-(glutamine-N5) methyltransferase, release factor-specific [Deltaproteobacteria bacterium RIFCSPLOWO2_02_FULL_55_12]OIJ74810.1 MAG: protein-(glutamine-N5) methyltransferase, release factor-specific [Deltaproteobacteria bacterium GWC2_55_46]
MKDTGLTTGTALIWAYNELSKGGVPDARSESEFILMHILGAKRHELLLNAGKKIGERDENAIRDAVKRRLNREPSQYIFGEAEFRGLVLKVTRDVLIPRPETELLVEEAIKTIGQTKERLTIIDLCTGSGCIAVSTAKEIPGAIVYASDISANALKVASENAQRAGVAERVVFLEGDLFGALPRELRGRAQMLLSNPPYIADMEIETLDPEVKDFEPRGALAGGADGLRFIRRILREAPAWLAPGGWLAIEIGYGQSKDVMAEAEATGAYDNIKIINDYGKIERIFKARSKA